MTLSHTREASLTKIQRHNVHSVSVSFFFFLCPPFPFTFKRHSNQHTGHLESLLVFLAAAQTTAGGKWRTGSAAAEGGCAGMFLPNRWKSITVLHSHPGTQTFSGGDFTACADIHPFITKWINVPESHRSTSFKKKKNNKKKINRCCRNIQLNDTPSTAPWSCPAIPGRGGVAPCR